MVMRPRHFFPLSLSIYLSRVKLLLAESAFGTFLSAMALGSEVSGQDEATVLVWASGAWSAPTRGAFTCDGQRVWSKGSSSLFFLGTGVGGMRLRWWLGPGWYTLFWMVYHSLSYACGLNANPGRVCLVIDIFSSTSPCSSGFGAL